MNKEILGAGFESGTGSECNIDVLVHRMLDDDRQYDFSKIISTYEFAEKAHRGQFRKSGEPYIVHPITVSFILVDLGMDDDTICAAMLHDVVEDTDYTLEDIKKRFGQDVAMLVDGVTKLDKIPIFNKQEQLAENVRKILLAMVQDIRVMIIKLADRLHNMRTLKYRSPDGQRRTAMETMQIYAPIAHRLGIRAMKDELEDLSFRYLDPYAYQDIERTLESTKEERERMIEIIKERIANRLKDETFMEKPYISGRAKSIYSIYKKTFMKHRSIDEVYDKYAVRVIVSTSEECYNVLGIIHDMFRAVPNRFKDYISLPKANNYQSVHTTVIGEEGIPFEVQIRTWNMHYTAEYGIAAHWKYKEGIKGRSKDDERINYFRQIMDLQKSFDDVEEIVNIIKNDLAPEDIIVFTPKGATITLPIGATIIDFAYRIHTEVGHNMMGAKVDGRIVPLDYKLQMGEIVEIITGNDSKRGPSRSWLDIAKTNEAKSKIRLWFKRECREENIIYGKELLEKELRKIRISISKEEFVQFLADDFKRHSCSSIDDFYAGVGYGGISIEKIIPHIKKQYEKKYDANSPKEIPDVSKYISKLENSDENVIVENEIDGCKIRYSQCCNPLPGDDIIGFITRGHGVSIHKKTCSNYLSAKRRGVLDGRWIEVNWKDVKIESYLTSIEVIATDRIGLMQDVCSVISNSRIPIHHSSSGMLKNGNAIVKATVSISSMEQLSSLSDKIRKVKDVISVGRV